MNTNESSTESKGKQVGKQLAYPHTELDPHGRVYGEHAGMTKREVIAMHLGAGLLAGTLADGSCAPPSCYPETARAIVQLADALLEALNE